MVQPVVVAFDSTVGNPPVTAGEPGNRPFDHGSMLAVGVGNSVVREVLSVFALELVVFAETDFASTNRGGAPCPKWAVVAGRTVGDVAFRADRSGQVVGAGLCVRVGVEGEIVDDETTGNRRHVWLGFDHRVPSCPRQRGQHVTGGIR